jgi:hypothetical protein
VGPNDRPRRDEEGQENAPGGHEAYERGGGAVSPPGVAIAPGAEYADPHGDIEEEAEKRKERDESEDRLHY